MPENPVKTGEAAAILKMGRTRICAAKRKLGLNGRWVLVSVLRKFFIENPNFSEKDVYHPANCKCQACRDWVADGHKRKDFSNRKKPQKAMA